MTKEEMTLRQALRSLIAAQSNVMDGHPNLESAISHRYVVVEGIVDLVNKLVGLPPSDPRAQLRTCAVGPSDEPLPGWFHCWTGLSEDPHALVEFPQGHAVPWPWEEFTFTDTPEWKEKQDGIR